MGDALERKAHPLLEEFVSQSQSRHSLPTSSFSSSRKRVWLAMCVDMLTSCSVADEKDIVCKASEIAEKEGPVRSSSVASATEEVGVLSFSPAGYSEQLSKDTSLSESE